MNSGIWNDLRLKFFKSGSPAMLYIGINILIFVIVALLNVGVTLAGYRDWVESLIQDYFAFPSTLNSFPIHIYTVLTYQFFHSGIFHILFNMLWLYWFGQIFLDFLKPRQFHFVYLGGGIFGALTFLLLFNVAPIFAGQNATLVGASASVMAILAATATLVPDYSIRLLLIGELKLKYLVLAYLVFGVIGLIGNNAGGSIAHLGGALFGFIFIKLLQNGNDWSTIFNRKPKLKVVKNKSPKRSEFTVNQKEIDKILDKISKSGYDQLSKEEKETLFKASKNQ